MWSAQAENMHCVYGEGISKITWEFGCTFFKWFTEIVSCYGAGWSGTYCGGQDGL